MLKSHSVNHWTAHGLMNERELQGVTNDWENPKTADSSCLCLCEFNHNLFKWPK